MKKYLLTSLALATTFYFTGMLGELVLLFKNEDGHTNWQYLANWSSGVFAILLSILAMVLFSSLRARGKAHCELETISNDLELRVLERTSTLDRSNHRLQDEIEQHLKTTNQLNLSEHYLASILKSMPSMLVGLNPKGEITQWNEKAEKYTGILAQNAIGKDLWKVYPIITITREQVNHAFGKTTPTTIRQSQRGLFHFDITIFPIDEACESGVVLLLDDVSKQVKSENKLIQRDKLSAMGELASSMAHDMNVPLQGMLEDIDQIQQQVLKLSQKEFSNDSLKEPNEIAKISNNLTDAIEQGKKAVAIVENLLDFASAQLDDKQKTAITGVVDHALELAENILSPIKGLCFNEITIKKEYDKNLPKLSCHVSEIQQVFFSLFRHCLHGLANVKVKDFEPLIKIRILEGYDSLWIKVSHNGIGLTSDEQQSIFEPYFSNQPLDNKDDANKRLSFSHFVITEQHTGQLAVTSDVKLGTTFHIQFD